MSFHQALDLIFELDEVAIRCTRENVVTSSLDEVVTACVAGDAVSGDETLNLKSLGVGSLTPQENVVTSSLDEVWTTSCIAGEPSQGAETLHP
ncbi:hypothetical protein Tco_1025784 [Tanacetum coccineum]